MNYWDKKLSREQLDIKLRALRQFDIRNIQGIGWIKTIREALGMSAKELGKKAGIDQSRISRLENAEIEGDLKMSSLMKIAEALNMRFVYGFVPNESLETMVLDQAKKIATKRMSKVNQTMRLEQQELSNEEKIKAYDDLVQKVLLNPPKNFWDQ